MEKIEYSLPIWAIAAIVNGDESHMSDGETEVLDEFLAEVRDEFGTGHWSFPTDIDEAKEFSFINEVDGLAGDIIIGEYIVMKGV